jgi:hypothetical protein
MKRLALAIVGLALTATGSGCCGCLSHIFHPYGGGCNPCGSPCGQMAPLGGCPNGACGYGPVGYAAPAGGTAFFQPYGSAPMFAAVANNPTL